MDATLSLRLSKLSQAQEHTQKLSGQLSDARDLRIELRDNTKESKAAVSRMIARKEKAKKHGREFAHLDVRQMVLLACHNRLQEAERESREQVATLKHKLEMAKIEERSLRLCQLIGGP